MSYVKLFAEILDSTIWQESHATKLTWITMLAMSNRDGEVMASVPGLASRVRIPISDCKDALKCFMSPDPYSRTKEHEGRRIEEIDGGWRLLNYEKFRMKMTRESSNEKVAERMRKYREKLRDKASISTECVCCNQPFSEPRSLYAVSDHDHATGALRGIICKSCNKIIGDIERTGQTGHRNAELCRAYIARYVTVTENYPGYDIAEAEEKEEEKAPDPERVPARSKNQTGSKGFGLKVDASVNPKKGQNVECPSDFKARGLVHMPKGR